MITDDCRDLKKKEIEKLVHAAEAGTRALSPTCFYCLKMTETKAYRV